MPQAKRIILIFIIGFWAHLFSFGQKSQVQIGIGAGWANYSIKNESVSSFIHSGSTLPITLFFRSSGNKGRHQLQLNYVSVNLSSSSGGLVTKLQTGCLQYSHHRKALGIKNKLYLYVGGTLNFIGSKRTNSGIGSSEASYITGEGFITFGPSALIEMPIGRDFASSQIGTSLIGISYQAGYARSEPYRENWLGTQSLFYFYWRTGYCKGLNDHWFARIDYLFQYYRLSKYESLASIANQISLGIIYKIR